MAYVRDRNGGEYSDSNPSRIRYKINDDGTLDTIGVTSSSPLGGESVYISLEADPELQDFDNDQQYGAGETVCVSGFVKFMNPSGQLYIELESYDSVADTVAGASSDIAFKVEPGFAISPPSSSTDYIFGIVASTEQVGPILVGDAGPNTSAGPTLRNNGGYGGAPPEVGVEHAFSVCFELGETPMKTNYYGDFGDGYCQGLEFVNPAHPVPGEPSYQDPCEHPIHRLLIRLSGPGSEVDEDGMKATLRGVVVGYSTCQRNPDLVDPTQDLE